MVRNESGCLGANTSGPLERPKRGRCGQEPLRDPGRTHSGGSRPKRKQDLSGAFITEGLCLSNESNGAHGPRRHSSNTARVYVCVWPRVLLIVPCYDLARFCIPYFARFCIEPGGSIRQCLLDSLDSLRERHGTKHGLSSSFLLQTQNVEDGAKAIVVATYGRGVGSAEREHVIDGVTPRWLATAATSVSTAVATRVPPLPRRPALFMAWTCLWIEQPPFVCLPSGCMCITGNPNPNTGNG